MNHRGILILGHGTPSKEGTQAFLDFVLLVEEMAGDTPVSAGFMEFASPALFEGLSVLENRGAAKVAVVPVFLSGAGHTANDLPPMIAEAKNAFPRLRVLLTPHVGSHPKVMELSLLRFREAVAGRPEVSAEDTTLVIAAHGSPEPEAFEELEKFAIAREKLTPGVRVVPCFSQMGKPLLKDILPAIAETDCRRVVVQPHFLLKGRLVESIASTVAGFMKQHPEIDWIVAEPLGGHRLLAEAVLELGGRVKYESK